MSKDGLGWWFAPCCIHDLRHVRTEEDWKEARWLEMEIGGMWWRTLEEALSELSCDGWDEQERAMAAAFRAAVNGRASNEP